jgi:hypothetical protein
MKPRNRTLQDALTAAVSTDPVNDSFGAEENAASAEIDMSRRGILVRVSPELRRKLKVIAINRGVTMQDLMLNAISSILEEPDRTPAP